jgi:hypothetical protein
LEGLGKPQRAPSLKKVLQYVPIYRKNGRDLRWEDARDFLLTFGPEEDETGGLPRPSFVVPCKKAETLSISSVLSSPVLTGEAMLS